MSQYRNVLSSPNGQTFRYQISLGIHGVIKNSGFNTAEAAAWEADKVRLLFSDFIRKGRDYNFPDRVENINEGELGCLPASILARYRELCQSSSVATNPAVPEVGVEKPPTAEDKLDILLQKQLEIVTARGLISQARKLLEEAQTIADKHDIPYRWATHSRSLTDFDDRCRLVTIDTTDDINALKSQQLGYGKIEGSTPL